MLIAETCRGYAIVEAENASVWMGAEDTPSEGNHKRGLKLPDILRPICATLRAEELPKTNDLAYLKGQNSREICCWSAILRSDFNSTVIKRRHLPWPPNSSETSSSLAN